MRWFLKWINCSSCFLLDWSRQRGSYKPEYLTQQKKQNYADEGNDERPRVSHHWGLMKRDSSVRKKSVSSILNLTLDQQEKPGWDLQQNLVSTVRQVRRLCCVQVLDEKFPADRTGGCDISEALRCHLSVSEGGGAAGWANHHAASPVWAEDSSSISFIDADSDRCRPQLYFTLNYSYSATHVPTLFMCTIIVQRYYKLMFTILNIHVYCLVITCTYNIFIYTLNTRVVYMYKPRPIRSPLEENYSCWIPHTQYTHYILSSIWKYLCITDGVWSRWWWRRIWFAADFSSESLKLKVCRVLKQHFLTQHTLCPNLTLRRSGQSHLHLLFHKSLCVSQHSLT